MRLYCALLKPRKICFEVRTRIKATVDLRNAIDGSLAAPGWQLVRPTCIVRFQELPLASLSTFGPELGSMAGLAISHSLLGALCGDTDGEDKVIWCVDMPMDELVTLRFSSPLLDPGNFPKSDNRKTISLSLQKTFF